MAKFNFKKQIFTGGFTLLEALVATSILMVAVTAPITIAQKGLSSAAYSKNQMIASYLAQDAIEYIKNKRDENFILNKTNSTDWLNGFDDCLGDNLCAIDTVKNNGTGEITEDETKKITKEKDAGDNFEFYGYGNGVGFNETNFTRSINIKERQVGVESLITVTVDWGTGSVVVKTLMYNY
jgi:type II secretory pathway pseudopilin PulG